jgi:hypothetical protein
VRNHRATPKECSRADSASRSDSETPHNLQSTEELRLKRATTEMTEEGYFQRRDEEVKGDGDGEGKVEEEKSPRRPVEVWRVRGVEEC